GIALIEIAEPGAALPRGDRDRAGGIRLGSRRQSLARRVVDLLAQESPRPPSLPSPRIAEPQLDFELGRRCQLCQHHVVALWQREGEPALGGVQQKRKLVSGYETKIAARARRADETEKDAVYADVERLHGHVGADIVHSVPASPIARERRVGFRRRARPGGGRAASGLAGRLIDVLHELQEAIPIAL